MEMNDLMPDMLAQGIDTSSTTGYRARINLYRLGTDNDDDQMALERLLTRGVDGSNDIVIMSRKESISPNTGIYTCVINYLERNPVDAERSE